MRRKQNISIAIAMTIVVFILDVLIPWGFIEWMVYIIPILLAAPVLSRLSILLFPIVDTILIVLGFFLSPTAGTPARAIINRALGILVLWTTSILIIKRKRAEEAVERSYRELEQRVEERTAELRQVNASLQLEVTERKHAEESLRTSEANYRAIFDSANDAIFVHDIQTGDVISVNRKTSEMYGRSPEEFRNFSSEALFSGVPGYNVQDALQWIRRAAEGPPQLFEWLSRKKDGKLFWVEVNLKRAIIGGQTRLLAVVRDITERKQVEESLKLTRFSVDHASVSAFLIGTDASIQYVNEQACRTLGYSREELMKMKVPDLDPNFLISVWNDHWTQLKKEGFLRFESLHRRKDGTLIPVEISVNYLAFGGREYNWAFALDISERKRAESSLRQSYTFTKTIIDSMNDAISLIDVRDFTIVGVNNVFLQSYGYTDESEIVGKHCYEITHHRPDVCSPPDDICPLIDTVRTQEHFAVDHVHYDRQGNRIYVEVSTSPIKDEAGNVVQVVHVQRNITERKIAEEALRESEERFRAFFELAAVGAVQLDPATGRFLRVNSRFCEITGYTRDELLSRTFRDLTHPDDREQDSKFFERIKSADFREYNAEKRYVHKDGHIVWVHISATIIRNAEGKPLRTAGIVQDITERKRMEDEIRHLALHDSLTGLPNRRLFNDIAGFELAQAERNKKKLAVLFLDLDRFKEINDTLGHEAGDLLLKDVAFRLKSLLRKSDSIGRIGGDEFNIILSDIHAPEDVSDIARKIVDSFRNPFWIAGHELRVTTSVGISIYPDDSDEVEGLLRYSDIAMYHAKEKGRNSYHFYDPSINIRSVERMRLENMLRRSLELREMVVYYQPQIDIASGKIVCAEALLRWLHPEKGLLPAKDFISTAEETGFIAEIDEWVLWAVCKQIRAWTDAGLPPVCITVNVSARQFQNPELLHKIDSVLKETGAAPDCLDIEITESMAMSDVERSAALMRGLAGMGIHISIDDFGTGYSSLNYLKRMPIEKLKIDRSFIQDIAVDRDDREIIHAVTAMAHNMRMKVIAEGVETEEQLSFLRESRCDEAQGFLFSAPLPPEQFREVVGAGR